MQGGGKIGIHGEEVVEGRQLEGTLIGIILSSMLTSAGTGHRSPLTLGHAYASSARVRCFERDGDTSAGMHMNSHRRI